METRFANQTRVANEEHLDKGEHECGTHWLVLLVAVILGWRVQIESRPHQYMSIQAQKGQVRKLMENHKQWVNYSDKYTCECRFVSLGLNSRK